MDDPLLVGVLQRGADLPADVDDFLPRTAEPAAEHIVERLALDKLHREEWGSLVVPGGVEAHDVRVFELLEDFALTLEAAPGRLVAAEAEGNDLEGHGAVFGHVRYLVDRAHGPAAELLLDGEVSHSLADS